MNPYNATIHPVESFHSVMSQLSRDSSEYEALPFPLKLHAMLTDAEEYGFRDVVSWQNDGKCFKVHKVEAFTSTIMTTYFKQTKYKSFQRQLNIYGFRRVTFGPNKGSYSHKCFLRGFPETSTQLVRKKSAAATTAKGATPQRQESAPTASSSVHHKRHYQPSNHPPSYYHHHHHYHHTQCNDPMHDPGTVGIPPRNVSLESCAMSSTVTGGVDGDAARAADATATAALAVNNDDIASSTFCDPRDSSHQHFADPFNQWNLFSDFSSGSGNNMEVIDDLSRVDPMFSMDQHPWPREASQKDFSQQHSPTDTGSSLVDLLQFADVPLEESPLNLCSQHAPSPFPAVVADEDSANDAAGLPDQEQIFPWKLHRMLEDSERQGFQSIVSWVKKGTAFKVHNSSMFLKKIMPNYFDQTKYESFRRQLNLYGFTRIARGPDRGIYSRPCFLQSNRQLCGEITRRGTGDAPSSLSYPTTTAIATTTSKSDAANTIIDESFDPPRSQLDAAPASKTTVSRSTTVSNITRSSSSNGGYDKYDRKMRQAAPTQSSSKRTTGREEVVGPTPSRRPLQHRSTRLLAV